MDTNLSTTTDPNEQNDGDRHHRHRRNGAWVDLTATVPAGTTAIRFRYWTDVRAVESGFRVDNVAVGGTVIGTAETADEGWDVRRLQPPAAAGDREADTNAYIAENRQYDGYDESLEDGVQLRVPRARRSDNWVETHPYMHGSARQRTGTPSTPTTTSATTPVTGAVCPSTPTRSSATGRTAR